MDTAKQHWQILRRVPDKLARKVREFMVIGEVGEGVLLATKSGNGYWLGEMRFGMFGEKPIQAIEPTRLDVPKLASMANGDGHILLLNEEGQIHVMGDNYYGQLGLGTVDEETLYSPQLISSPHKFVSVRCGGWHSLALTEDGKVWAWGSNKYGQVGVPTSIGRPHPFFYQISELDSHRVVAIECGGLQSFALTDRGDVYAWGANKFGQLGHENEDMGGSLYIHRPTRIPTRCPIKSIVAGNSHTLLLTQTGEVYACGWNKYGQLGLSTTTELSFRLVKVAGLPVISEIASHFYSHLSIAITSKHECFAWGQLDYSTIVYISTPRQLPPKYSTLDSVLSFKSAASNTPHSVRV